jgi:hypothetical protein
MRRRRRKTYPSGIRIGTQRWCQPYAPQSNSTSPVKLVDTACVQQVPGSYKPLIPLFRIPLYTVPTAPASYPSRGNNIADDKTRAGRLIFDTNFGRLHVRAIMG